MVRDVIDPAAITNLVGSMGIGHGERRMRAVKLWWTKLRRFPRLLRRALTTTLWTSSNTLLALQRMLMVL